MRHPILTTLAALLLAFGLSGAANAGPFDDALASYNRGDHATAFRLWRPLADQGLASAQFFLGLMYAKGEGVPQDNVQAQKWFNLAGAGGVEDGREGRDMVTKEMTLEQIDKALVGELMLGRYREAEPLQKRALTIREKALGPDHPDVATSLNNLAGIYRKLGRYGEVEPLYKGALAIYEKVLGPDHPDVVMSLNNLAENYRVLGRYGEAEQLYKRALTIREKALGPQGCSTLTT